MKNKICYVAAVKRNRGGQIETIATHASKRSGIHVRQLRRMRDPVRRVGPRNTGFESDILSIEIAQMSQLVFERGD
jgi:hypothetical protein